MVLGLDMRICWVFWRKNFVSSCLDACTVLKKAIQSFRPFDFAQGSTPALGRAEAPLRGALFAARLKPCP